MNMSRSPNFWARRTQATAVSARVRLSRSRGQNGDVRNSPRVHGPKWLRSAKERPVAAIEACPSVCWTIADGLNRDGVPLFDMRFEAVPAERARREKV
jgi:hypothetical protein